MKKTKKEMFNELLNVAEVAENAEMVAFINHEIELLSKKATTGKSNAKQMENDNLKREVMEILKEAENPMTITEIVRNMKIEYSNQKISALTNQLVKLGYVEKEMDKKTSKFKIA